MHKDRFYPEIGPDFSKMGSSQKSSLDLDDREDGPMSLKFKLTKKSVNTQFGPVAALLAYYQQTANSPKYC